jgi:serine/threonine protein kinase
MPQIGGKPKVSKVTKIPKKKSSSSTIKHHFTVVMRGKEHGLYVSSTPSSAARKAVTKLCAANKSKKVEFYIREITQGSKKKTYGPYEGYIEKLKEPIELKGRVIKYKPVAKLSGKTGAKKGGRMKGGGYDAKLNVNKDINRLLGGSQYDRDNTLEFTIINTQNKEIIIYSNIRCLGQGTYGKVFLVSNNGKEYVIKITKKDPDFFLQEPQILNSFMNKIDSRCQYKAISQGKTIIQEVNIGHIIFPFKGGIDLAKVIDKRFFNLIPKILGDMISCLILINKFACHGDLRLENIVYDEVTNNSFIIDYGLSYIFPINIDELNKITIGNRQISVEIIIAYLLKIINSNSNNLYSQYIDSIQNTIDNFGLFWIIIESICGENIFKEFFSDDIYLIRATDKKEFNNYLNFYFNLDNNGNPTELMQKIKGLFNYSDHPNFRIEFIKYIYSKISREKFSFYFNNNKQLYINFMVKVLALVRVDPTTRISKEILLQDPFFHRNTKSLLPNINSNLLKQNFRLPKQQFELPSVPNNLLKQNFGLPKQQIRLPSVPNNSPKQQFELPNQKIRLPSVPNNSPKQIFRLPNINSNLLK